MSTPRNSYIELQSNLAECFGEELHDLDQSLWDMFRSTAKKYPDRDAVMSIWQPQEHLRNLTGNQAALGSVDVMRWSYADLLTATELVASWLESQGCTAGQRLVVFLWNSTEWALFFWVAARLRMSYIPLDPRNMEQSADEYLKLLQSSVLVVQDEATAINFEKACSRLKDVKIRISCNKSAPDSWTSLCDLSSPSDSTIVQELTSRHMPVKGNSPGQDLALIVFTSGTTSIPKGCCHTAANLWSQSHDFDPETEPNLFDKWLVHTPVSHIFAINNALRAWRYGGSVMFASKSFDINMSLEALKEHRCTRMSAVPTLVQALLSHPEWDNEKESLALRYVSLGGTLIKGEDIKICKRLGSDAVIQAYGMSEGAPISSDKRVDPRLLSADYPGVGKVLPGARLRICELGSQTTLNRNVPGELHIGGTSVIAGYLNDENPESFYTDEYGSWLRTGDQALIDDNGVLQILGRYKDLIIRGGENISPAKIESHMGQIPGLLAQVVGIPDEISGELPVAVVHSLGSSTKIEIMKHVEALGSIYTLAAIITLDELGIKHYPATPTGKVRKDALKQLVLKHLFPLSDSESLHSKDSKSAASENTEAPSTPLSSESSKTFESVQFDHFKVKNESSANYATIQQLISIWTNLVAVAPKIDSSVLDFADSITLLRYCDKVWRTLGKKLFLQDFLENETIEKQARLLESRDTIPAQQTQLNTSPSADKTDRTDHGPPELKDVVQANGEPSRFKIIQNSVAKVLEGLGLMWESDVEDIIPIKDSQFAIADGARPQTFRHRMAFKIKDRSPEQVRRALERGLLSRPMFRTILVKLPDGTLAHVVVRPGKAFYDMLITKLSVPSEAAVQEMIMDDSSKVFSRIKMFQAVIATMEKSVILILTYNHSVFDAMSMIPWNRDLDMLLGDPDAALLTSTPFKFYADMTYSQQIILPAKLDVQYMVKRLSGIGEQTKAFWPRQRAPGWMIGNDESSEYQHVRMRARKSEPIKYPRTVAILRYPHLLLLKSKNIQPYIVVKTAIAIFNIQQTGQNHAIFTNLDAGRSWPFMPSRMPLPPPMSIDGPTLELTVNMFHMFPTETVGHLLERVRDDQKELSSHAHAPLFRVLDGLKEEERPVVMDALQRQMFNWDISLSYLNGNNEDWTMMKPFGRVDWPDGGFIWEAGMMNSEELCILATWDDAQLGVKEVEDHVSSLNEIVRWITEPQNWDEPIGTFLGRK